MIRLALTAAAYVAGAGAIFGIAIIVFAFISVGVLMGIL